MTEKLQINLVAAMEKAGLAESQIMEMEQTAMQDGEDTKFRQCKFKSYSVD